MDKKIVTSVWIGIVLVLAFVCSWIVWHEVEHASQIAADPNRNSNALPQDWWVSLDGSTVSEEVDFNESTVMGLEYNQKGKFFINMSQKTWVKKVEEIVRNAEKGQ